MKPENHLRKAEDMEATLSKLNKETDYEAIIELCMLISAHYSNAALHELRVTPIDRDIKHTKLAGLVKRRSVDELSDIRKTIDALEKLRPRHIYGKGSDGKTAEQALRMLEKVKETCMKVLS